MTVRVLSPEARRRAFDLAGVGVGVSAVVAFGLVFGVMAQEPTRVRLAVTGGACLAIVALIDRSPRHLLYVTVVWLALLGMLRRLVTDVGTPSHTDPMLLVAPLAFVLLVVVAADHGALVRRGVLANSVLALQALIILGALNPLQGSIVGGVAGLLFVLVPTLGFWIGRGLCDDRTLGALFRLVAGLAVVVALYGLMQTFVRFPSWDEKWLHSASIVSLNVNGVIRPFGTMSSSAEYGTFLAIGLLVWVSYSIRLRLLPLGIPVLALIGLAIVLESSRGLIVLCVAAIGLVLGAKARLPGFVAAGLAVLLLAGLAVTIRHLTPSSFGTGASGQLVAHQITGLSNPLDPNASTVTAHLTLLKDGLEAAYQDPFGQGVGVITIAGSRFGGTTIGTELDPSNVGVALGLPGLVLYVIIVIAGFGAVYALARRRTDVLPVAALGVIGVTALQWLNGGEYAVAILPWLVLGWADRSTGAEPAT